MLRFLRPKVKNILLQYFLPKEVRLNYCSSESEKCEDETKEEKKVEQKDIRFIKSQDDHCKEFDTTSKGPNARLIKKDYKYEDCKKDVKKEEVVETCDDMLAEPAEFPNVFELYKNITMESGNEDVESYFKDYKNKEYYKYHPCSYYMMMLNLQKMRTKNKPKRVKRKPKPKKEEDGKGKDGKGKDGKGKDVKSTSENKKQLSKSKPTAEVAMKMSGNSKQNKLNLPEGKNTTVIISCAGSNCNLGPVIKAAPSVSTPEIKKPVISEPRDCSLLKKEKKTKVVKVEKKGRDCHL